MKHWKSRLSLAVSVLCLMAAMTPLAGAQYQGAVSCTSTPPAGLPNPYLGTVTCQGVNGTVSITTVSGLASVAGKTAGTIAVVTDGNSATDCTTGTGSTIVTCQYSGSVWAAFGGSNYTLPTATNSVLGGVKPDGTSILNTAGVISATPGSVGAAPIDSPAFTGTLTAANVCEKARGTAYQYAACFSGATADVQLNAAAAALPAQGGMVDATGLAGTPTIAATIDLATTHASLLLPCGVSFHITISNGTPAISVGDTTTVVSNCAGLVAAGQGANLAVQSSANISSVLRCRANSSTSGCNGVIVKGISVIGSTSATISSGLIDTQNMFDASFQWVQTSVCSTNGVGIFIHAGNGTLGTHDITLTDDNFDCSHTAGSTGVYITRDGAASGGVGSVHAYGGDWGSAGVGYTAIYMDGGNGGNNNMLHQVDLHGIYMETDCTSVNPIYINDADSIVLDDVQISCNAGTSPGIYIHESSSGLTNSVTVLNYYQTNGTFPITILSNVGGCKSAGGSRVPFYECISSEVAGTAAWIGPVVVNGSGIVGAANATIIPTPVNSTFTDTATGGSLTNSTAYYYRIAATNAIGTTVASTETSLTTSSAGSNAHQITVTTAAVYGATGCNVYGRTTGAELLIAAGTVSNGVCTYTDAGSITPSGALPAANTTAGFSVSGTQIAAANLSNGTTGSGGAVVLATAPTLGLVNATGLPWATGITGRPWSRTIITGDPGAASVALTDDNDSPVAVRNDTGLDITITGVACYANAGTPIIDPVLTGGSATSILTGNLTCGAASWAAGTVQGTAPVLHSFTAGAPATCASTPCSIDANIVTAGGTAKYLVVVITGTQ